MGESAKTNGRERVGWQQPADQLAQAQPPREENEVENGDVDRHVPKPGQRYLTLAQTARYLGLGPRTVRHYIKNAEIAPLVLPPATGEGERAFQRFDREQLDAWMQSHRASAETTS